MPRATVSQPATGRLDITTPSVVYLVWTGKHATTSHPRTTPRHALPSHSAHPESRPASRVRHRKAHQGSFPRRPPNRGRFPVSRAQPHAGQGLARVRMGHFLSLIHISEPTR